MSSEATETAEGVHPSVRGRGVDAQTRCTHYRSRRDVVAVKMKCCGIYYACKDCHDALAGHAIETWPRSEWNERAVLCGVCGAVLTVRQSLECANACPACGALFNPGCRSHHPVYFEIADCR